MADRFDLDAIDADDALLDLLAAGGESARFAGENDPAVALLAELRLAVEVIDELPVETIDDPESFLARCAALNPVTDPFARKLAARSLALGVAAVAALSVSGVAAAVNGNPLSPYEKVIEKITDAVTPTTDFPKEQLDGYPVLNKTKFVKVQKNFQKKQEEKAAEAEHDRTLAEGELPQGNLDAPQPPLLRVMPPAKPSVIEQPLPQPTQTTQPPTQPQPGDPTTKPTDPAPTDGPTTEPTTPPETPPSTTPTDPPATPPPSTEPTTPPSTPAPTNNGETGNSDPGTAPSTAPTTVPGDTSSLPGQDSPGETGETGDGKPTGDVKPSTPPLGDQPGDTGDSKPEDTKPADTTPADSKPEDSKPVDEAAALAKLIAPVLPTPSGAPAAVESAVQYFGRGLELTGKHSNGKVTTGSVRQHYTKGKHSSGTYAEGKHAAIERTHGSLDDETVLRILGVLNKRTS